MSGNWFVVEVEAIVARLSLQITRQDDDFGGHGIYVPNNDHSKIIACLS